MAGVGEVDLDEGQQPGIIDITVKDDLQALEKIWATDSESLEDIERRIHDFCSPDQMHERANNYSSIILQTISWVQACSKSDVLEIGPGLGYVMQSMKGRLGLSEIHGLDISQSMIQSAVQRFRRDGLSEASFRMHHYDGLNVPFEDNSFDFIYSTACIQHIPKPYAYLLFYEIMRILRSGGVFVCHLLSWSHMADFEKWRSFREENEAQISKEKTHWHHFYSVDELLAIFNSSIKCARIECVDNNGCLIMAAKKQKSSS